MYFVLDTTAAVIKLDPLRLWVLRPINTHRPTTLGWVIPPIIYTTRRVRCAKWHDGSMTFGTLHQRPGVRGMVVRTAG